MTIALSKTHIDQLDDVRKNAVSQMTPSLFLGDPVLMEDENGKQWYTFSDSRWSLMQVAMLACIGLNIDALKGYDSAYVDDETGEITDHDALHAEAVAALQDPGLVDPTMTLPEDVEPSDPDADRPSYKDVRAAQEPTGGDLDDKVRVSVDTSAWTRVETELA
jgi:hypothetical protein